MRRPARVLDDALRKRRVLTVPPQVEIDDPRRLRRARRRHQREGGSHTAGAFARMRRNEQDDAPAFRRCDLRNEPPQAREILPEVTHRRTFSILLYAGKHRQAKRALCRARCCKAAARERLRHARRQRGQQCKR